MKPEKTTVEQADEQPIAPCKHMEEYVSGVADGSLRGPMRWYTLLHASYCKHCSHALRSLRILRGRLGRINQPPAMQPTTTLTETRRAALERAMREAEETSEAPR